MQLLLIFLFMLETYTVRLLNNTHTKDIVNLILPIQQIEFHLPVTLESQQDLLDIEKHYHLSGGNFWGAVYNEKLIGTLALIDIGHNAGAVRKMFVQKEYRGKELGIAQHLFDTLKDFCMQKSIATLYLGTVKAMNAAHRFYERNGFQEIDEDQLPDYYPRVKVDTVFYRLKL